MSTLEISQLLGNYGEFVGAIAIVVTLIYLAVQIRQNTASSQAASRDSMARLTYDFTMRIASDDSMASLFRRGQNDPNSLDDDELFLTLSDLSRLGGHVPMQTLVHLLIPFLHHQEEA